MVDQPIQTSPYSRQQVMEALERKGFQGRCEACGKEGQLWTLFTDPETDKVEYASMLRAFYFGPPPSVKLFSFAALACTNCGYTRHHILETLMDGLEDHDG